MCTSLFFPVEGTLDGVERVIYHRYTSAVFRRLVSSGWMRCHSGTDQTLLLLCAERLIWTLKANLIEIHAGRQTSHLSRTDFLRVLAIVCSHDKACIRQMTSEKLQYIITGYGLLLNRYWIVLVCIAMHRRNESFRHPYWKVARICSNITPD